MRKVNVNKNNKHTRVLGKWKSESIYFREFIEQNRDYNNGNGYMSLNHKYEAKARVKQT